MKNKPVKISIEQVKELRELTGAPILECRTALEKFEGDQKQATEWLKQQGLQRVAKKADREMKAGFVEAYTHAGKIGVLVELSCETDFVAMNEDFKKLAHEIALQVASMGPKDVDSLMEQSWVRDDSKTIADLVKEGIAKFGENISICRFHRFQLGCS